MNINQLSKEYEILPAVREVVGLTKTTTGKDLDFQLAISLNTDGISKIARERMAKHIIKIKENSTARVNHIIVHECGHILRMMMADPSERVVPSSNKQTVARACEDIESEMVAIPAAARKDMLEIWTTGVINQLVNLPVDVRIERWIYSVYSSLREVQKKSIAVDVENILLGLSDKVEKHTIKSIFSKSNAMVYAYLRGISYITGENYSACLKKHPGIKKTGRKLYSCLEVEDKGFAQDVETINAWAKILGINDWFAWIGFEDVPESYYGD